MRNEILISKIEIIEYVKDFLNKFDDFIEGDNEKENIYYIWIKKMEN
jgi:hypothetical protein